MANEITASGSIEYNDTLVDAALSVSAKVFNSAGKIAYKGIQSVGTTEEEMQVGDVANLGAFFIQNLDPTNYVEVKVATGGAIFARLAPDTAGDGKGGFVMGTRLGSGAQAPYLIANTAACKVAVLVIEQ